jgi:hypothetical protein
MKEQDKIGIDRFRGRYSEEELPAGNFAAAEASWALPTGPRRAENVGLQGRLAARARRSLFVSLLLAAVMLAAPVASPAEVEVGVSVAFGPPALPVYVQPLCPGPGFIWAPGYWAWDPGFGYYWVPGLWVLTPFVGALWTPGYWGWRGGVFIWHEGYWGPVVGFYGGINYGFGYTGFGYAGGYWSGGRFFYNRTVNNISVTNVTTVYSKSVGSVHPSGASFNGGPGGTTARPTSKQLAAAREKRSSLTGAQKHQMQVARADPKQRATINHGRPAVAATTKPGEFKGGVISASRAGAPYKAPPSRKAEPRERVRTSKAGAEMHARAAAPEKRIAHPRKGPERRVSEPRRTPRRLETAKSPRPKEKTKVAKAKKESRRKTASGEHARTPKAAAKMHPRATEPVRIAHAAPRREPERFNEPRRMPQRPTTTGPLPQKGKTKGERKKEP